MSYASLRECVDDLDKTGQLVSLLDEVDPYLEAAAIHRRVHAAGGPAVLFRRVSRTPFPMVSNLFGTLERARFLFRHALTDIEHAMALLTRGAFSARSPLALARAARLLPHAIPLRTSNAPVLACTTQLSQLPAMTSWPKDGGPFVTLPCVYTENPSKPGWLAGNLGMYRVQLSGNDYERDREVGLHYQIHRGIGVHHAAAIDRDQPLRVNVLVGGPPSLALSAVMPLPEGVPELAFAGVIGARNVRLTSPRNGTLPIVADADFCIIGTIDPRRTKPEGPFGDHLGYYSLQHDFPVMTVNTVYHRSDAIWPFTVVGRPPQEDSAFGALIHELTGPAIPRVIPGVSSVNAVDEAGVHPLLLAVGSERYVPYRKAGRPAELLTQASAILGQGQMSLAKYLFIVARGDNPELRAQDAAAFFRHVLERIDPTRDLHFLTNTTIDTLDYSGTALNEGSKVIVASVGPKQRELGTEVPSLSLPTGFTNPRVAMTGVLVVQTAPDAEVRRLTNALPPTLGHTFPLLVLCDDSSFAARSLANWLWVTFTRSDPARDIYGVGEFTRNKAWGCEGPVVIDARKKPHHASALEEDPAIERKVDERFFRRGRPLARWA